MRVFTAGLAYCIQALLLYRSKMGLPITTFSNSRSFQASAPLKMVTMDLFPKTIARLNSYRNARITIIFEFVDKLDFTYFVFCIFHIGNYEF